MKDFFENLLSNGELQEKVAELQGKIDAYQMSENEANEIIAELKAYKDVNEDFKTAWEELKAENDRLKEEIKEVKKYQYEQEFLEKEIEEQREKNKRLTCKILEVKALNETLNVQCTSQDCTQLRKLHQTLQEIKAIAEPFAKCYTHTCKNCEKYDSAHACCLKDINCYKYNDGNKSSCKDFVLPTKQFYQQILANVITKITKAEEEWK